MPYSHSGTQLYPSQVSYSYYMLFTQKSNFVKEI